MLNQPSAVDDRVPNKRQLAEQAIALALQGRWEEAAQANRRLLAFYPNEPDAYNRLGKALTELGRYGEAREAYGQALSADPGNAIARRNLDRLKMLGEQPQTAAATSAKGEKMDPRLFVEEPGKTYVTQLHHTAPADVLARHNAGDLLTLRPAGRSLAVENSAGERLGEFEPRLAQRVLTFMTKGNQYVAAVKSLDGNDVRVFIRETLQHPSLAGRPTFPTRAEAGYRAYTRDSLSRYDEEEFDEEYDEAEGEYVERERHEEEAEEEEPATIVHELDHGFDIEHDEE